VKANHSCAIEKISDSKIFYLRSRWVWKENALQMMVEWYIVDLFKCLNMIDKDFYEKLVLEIKENII
jgi:Fe-S cluster assembly scaffold protein SufB